MKVTIDGQVYDYDRTKEPMSEALWVEDVYGRKYAEWRDDMGAGSARAWCMLACLILRRNGRDVTLDDISSGKFDFDFAEFLASTVETSDGEGGADPTTPGESPGPDGTPTTGTAT